MIKNRGRANIDDKSSNSDVKEKDSNIVVTMRESHAKEAEGMNDLDVEKLNARRMLRVAGWSTIFCTPWHC